mgnify:CR=1 FL=1
MVGASLRVIPILITILFTSSLLVSADTFEGNVGHNPTKDTNSLIFGSISGSNFVIEPGVGANILVNITNQGSIADSANVSVTSVSGWNIVWPRNSEPSIGEDISIESNELVWIQFRVDVPIVENGAPLAGSKHAISVKAISLNGGMETFWNFTIEVTEVSGISIDNHQNSATIEPGEKVLLPVDLRNVGNHNAKLVIKIQPMLESGLPVEGTIPDQSFTYNGWSVGTFDLYKIENLGANDSGIVLIEYAAPFLESSEISVRISAFNEFEPLEIVTVNQSVKINRIRDVSMYFDDSNGCDIIQPSNSSNSIKCHENISVSNSGNFNDVFQLQVLSNPIWSNVELGVSEVSLAKGETVNNIDVSIEIYDGTIARTSGEISIGAFIDGELITIKKYQISVDSVIDWQLQNSESKIENENSTMTLTFENTGNDRDGFMISLDMNVKSNFGLIPPPNSIYEETDNIRFFEVRDIEPNQKFSFMAYATTPVGLEMNGTARLEVQAHSVKDPDVNFLVYTDIDYLGDDYRVIEPEDEPNLFSVLLASGINFISKWNGLILTLFVVSLGSILLNKALVKRQKDMKKFQIKTDVKQQERVEDWTKKFENTQEKVNPKIDPKEISTATNILDNHTDETNLKDADLLALGLIQRNDLKTLGEKLIPSAEPEKKIETKASDITTNKTIGKSSKVKDSTDTDFDLDL